MFALILFDIDGTLLDSGGAGIRSLNRALSDLTGIEGGFSGIDCAGKTDPQIIREGLSKLGLDPRDGLPGDIVTRYLGHLQDAMITTDGHLKPGVPTVLQKLQGPGKRVLGLLTGNLEQGARIKLEPFGLNPFFCIGAYGSDEEDRNRLLPIAVERFQQHMGYSLDFKECLVIGDTPLDVACAKVHGASCIAVATGPYSMEALQEAQADLVVPDLSDSEGIVRWIDGR